MNPTTHLGDVKDLRDANRQQRNVIVGLVLLAILLAVKALTNETVTVLEPPSRSQAIGRKGDVVDSGWLEEMGQWVAHMMLDATPQSIDWQQDQILKWVHPLQHGDLQQRMVAQAKRIKDANATTFFWVQQVASDVDGQRALLVGRLETYVNGVKTDAQTKSYVAGFKAKAGRNLIVAWDEVPLDDPWFVKQMAAQAEKEKKAAAAAKK